MKQSSLPYVLSLALAWGLNLVVSRVGIDQITVVEYTGLRFVIAVAIFALLIRLLPNRQWSRDRQVWIDSCVVGVFGTALPLLGIIGSLQFQSAGVTGLLVTTTPAFIVTVAHFALPDAKLTGMAVFGVVISLSGAVTLALLGENGLPNIQEANPIGYLMIFGVQCLDAGVAVYVRRRMQSYDTFEVTSIRMVAAMVFTMPFAMVFGATDYSVVDINGWGALLFSAVVSTVFAQFLFFYVTRVFGTTSLAITIYLVPIVALTSGAIFLGEEITMGMIVSMILILAGVYLINRERDAQPV